MNKYIATTMFVGVWILGMALLLVLNNIITAALLGAMGMWALAIMFPWALVSGMLYGWFVTKWLLAAYRKAVIA